MNQIWEETQVELQKRKPGISIKDLTLLSGFWWGFFLLSGGVSNYALRRSSRSETIDDMMNSTSAYMAAESLEIIAAILAIFLIKKISETETELYEQVQMNSLVPIQ